MQQNFLSKDYISFFSLNQNRHHGREKTGFSSCDLTYPRKDMVSIINSKHTKKSFPILVLISTINPYGEDRIFAHLWTSHLSPYFLFSLNFSSHENVIPFFLLLYKAQGQFDLFFFYHFHPNWMFSAKCTNDFFFPMRGNLPARPLSLLLSLSFKTRKFLESCSGVINVLQRLPKVCTHAERFCMLLGMTIRT